MIPLKYPSLAQAISVPPVPVSTCLFVPQITVVAAVRFLCFLPAVCCLPGSFAISRAASRLWNDSGPGGGV